jgi:hypothetical protein
MAFSMKEATMRNLLALLGVILALALLSMVGCSRKEQPPGPPAVVEPTAVPAPEPTAIPNPKAAVCKTDVPGSWTRCMDANKNLVTCPVNTSGLPECAP